MSGSQQVDRGSPDTTPPVTVVVPVFNGERYLRESIDSILGQTYPNIEILVVDDASTDGTPAIIQSYGARIASFRQPENRGIYGNMNDGIARAKGAYIAIYHADDVYDPRIVEREVTFLQRHRDVGAAFASDIFIDPEGGERGRLALPPEIRGEGPLDYEAVLNALLKYKNRFLRCPSCMVPAAIYRDLGGYKDKEFLNSSDLEMYLRIARAHPIGVLEEHLFRYRWGHGNSGQRYRHLRFDEERFFRIMDLYLEQGGRALASREALAAYEAHRNEDRLMRVVNLYIDGRLREARTILGQVDAGRIVASPQVQRGRLLALQALLLLLTRLPRAPFVASLFYKRWHGARKTRAEAGR